MKAFLSICLILALSFGANAVEDTTKLFETAWEHQKQIDEMQGEILQQLQNVRSAVSGVLKGSTRETLQEIERNALNFTREDSTVRTLLSPHLPIECVYDLVSILDGVTHLAGYDSAICLSRYNKPLQLTLSEAYEILASFDVVSNDVQQSVVRAFIAGNTFKDPQTIINRILASFNSNQGLWEDRRPEIEKFVDELKSSVSELNVEFKRCQTELQVEYKPSFDKVERRLDTCLEFAGIASNVRGARSAKITYVLEDFLPDRSKWIDE